MDDFLRTVTTHLSRYFRERLLLERDPIIEHVFLYRNHNVARHLEKLLQPVSGNKTASLLNITSTLPVVLNCSRVLATSWGDWDWFQNLSMNHSHKENKLLWGPGLKILEFPFKDYRTILWYASDRVFPKQNCDNHIKILNVAMWY